jgi:K+-sensing histidine kinase KdpD
MVHDAAASRERANGVARLHAARASPSLAVDLPTKPSALAVREALGLLSTVAHELRAPLTSVMMASDVLAEHFEELGAEEITKRLLTIRQGTLWMQGLVANLLCAAVIQAGHFQLRREPVCLRDVLAEIQLVIEPLLVQKGQRLRVSASGNLPEVPADRRRIGQVLMNLLSNASKFGKPDTVIGVALTAARTGDVARVAVTDSGPGISPADRMSLFEPFQRAAEASQAGKEGVGLGLAIVKAIVEAHGGRVGARNRRSGGACFWFDLPLAAAAAPAPLG